MPRSFQLFSIRNTTTIILVDSNLNISRGGLRHMDRSTNITNRDAFNVETTVTEQQPPPTTSFVIGHGNDGKIIIRILKHLEHWFGCISANPLGISRSFCRASWTWTRYKQNFRWKINLDAPWNWHLQVLRVCQRGLQPLDDHNLLKWQHRCMIRLVNSTSVIHVFMLTSISTDEDFTFWCRWTRIPWHHYCTHQEE